MRLTKEEQEYSKKFNQDNITASNRPAKKSKKKSQVRKAPFISLTINTVKVKQKRKKKIKMPAKSIKIFPKKKPQDTWLYKNWVK